MKKSDLPAKAAWLLLALQVLPYLCLVITAVDVFLARRGLDTGGILSLPVLKIWAYYCIFAAPWVGAAGVAFSIGAAVLARRRQEPGIRWLLLALSHTLMATGTWLGFRVIMSM